MILPTAWGKSWKGLNHLRALLYRCLSGRQGIHHICWSIFPCLGLAGLLNIKQPWESYPVTFQVRSAKAGNYPILPPTDSSQVFNEKKIWSINKTPSLEKVNFFSMVNIWRDNVTSRLLFFLYRFTYDHHLFSYKLKLPKITNLKIYIY